MMMMILELCIAMEEGAEMLPEPVDASRFIGTFPVTSSISPEPV
jgi:hypothetical protein